MVSPPVLPASPGGLGRLLAPDPRDRNYMALEAVPEIVPIRSVMHYSHTILNQGNTGTCVGHGWKGLLVSGPAVHGVAAPPSAVDIYCEAIVLDEWTDNDGDCAAKQFGTSVRAGAKALQKRGLINEYLWAFDSDTALQWLIQHGPLVVGTTWYNSMSTPDTRGYLVVDPASGVAGGHCYLVIGYSLERNAFRVVNSWGPGWGQHGRVWVWKPDLAKLIKDDGECCMSLDLVKAA